MSASTTASTISIDSKHSGLKFDRCKLKDRELGPIATDALARD
jgi:hypothetical protein